MQRNTLFLLIAALVATLCQPDQKLTAQPANTPPTLDCQVLRKKNKKTEGGDYDDQTERITMEILVKNTELRAYQGFAAELIVIGEVLDDEIKDRTVFIVLHKQTIKFDLDASEEKRLNSATILSRFDESDAARFGARYYGFVFFLKDKNGNVLETKTNNPALFKDPEAIAKMNDRQMFNRNFGEPKKASIYLDINLLPSPNPLR